VAHARKIIAAFNLPENKDKGVVQLDGRMVERLHADMARRTVRDRAGDRGDATSRATEAESGSCRLDAAISPKQRR
jgi:hypothetical protein